MANEERERVDRLPPYVPYRTFSNFLDGLKVGMPSHIDKSVMPSISGGMQSWLISALKSMKLIGDDGVPSPMLRKLATAEADTRKNLLQELFGSTYAFLADSGVDPSNTTPQKLEAVFMEMGAKGETVEKCVAFLKGLAKEAGITLSPHLGRVSRRPRGSGPSRARRSVNENRTLEEEEDEFHSAPAQTSEQALLGILDPDTMSEEEQKAVWTLLLFLKKQVKA